MKVQKTTLKDVLLFRPDVFEDHRGQFIELYNTNTHAKLIEEKTGQSINFVEDCLSISSRHVLRGIHGDDETWKLVNCLRGSVYTVIVNCNLEDENFGKWESFTLSEKNRSQVLVPPKYGTAHLVLSDEAFWHYKFSTHYDPENLEQFTYRFDDPKFNIWWPIKDPILSKRDEGERN
jgi:dTDP-4-dehydrorhamnose 3,5-epimerase